MPACPCLAGTFRLLTTHFNNNVPWSFRRRVESSEKVYAVLDAFENGFFSFGGGGNS